MSDITEKQYRQLKQDIEDARSAAERARGALDQTIATLKEDFGMENLKQAKDKLAALNLKAAAAQKEFESAFKAYQNKWDTPHEDGE